MSNSPSEPNASGSLFRQLAGALQLDGQAPPGSTSVLRAELDATELLPLHLPQRRRVIPTHWLALAAALGFLVLGSYRYFGTEADFGIKGFASVRLYWERAGVVQRFEPGMQLRNDDRVLAEILPSRKSEAYWGTFNHAGELLGSWEAVRDSRLDLEAGVARSFPSSLRLVGADEGETLAVLVCPAGPRLELQTQFTEAMQHKGYRPSAERCQASVFQLR